MRRKSVPEVTRRIGVESVKATKGIDMSNLFTQKFWRDLTERTVSSTAQGFLTGSGLAGGAAAAGQLTLDGFPWAAAFGGAGIMAVLTIVKCLAAIEIGSKGNASLDPAA